MILENLIGKKIILASQSPRRKQLLKDAGFDFEVFVKKNIEEKIGDLKGRDAALFLANFKSEAYRDIIIKDNVIITADTIVCNEGNILNKPKDFSEAQEMLKLLSGKKHEVITGVCIKSLEKKELFAETTQVYFKELSNKEINFYIENFKPYDKAGAYGIQEWIGYIGIEKIEGSYFNVVGLPIQKIYEKLKLF